jgi:DNA invertase Pin-like site-specific DNA recombinase
MVESIRLAVGYARVSLEEENIENQVRAIEDYAKANGIQLIGIFKDVGVSGAKPALEREGFRQMLNALENMPAVKTVIIYDISRLGRSMMDVVETYRLLTEKLGLNVLFIQHPELNVMQNTPLGEAVRNATLALLSIAAEIERALIMERTRVGMARAKAQGKHIGRKPVPIPMDEVRKYRKMGVPLSVIYRILVSEGHLRYRTSKGEEKVMSFGWFRQRIRQLLRES